MQLRFIGQGYDLAANSSLAQELIALFANEDYNEFRCLVAFATTAGVFGLTDHVKRAQANHLETVKVVVGIDQNGTSKEALEELLNWGGTSYVYHTEQPNTFHPKIYLFKGKERSVVIVGSNNLTATCLTQNVEGALVVEFENSDAQGVEVMQQVEGYFSAILGGTDPNLHQLDTAMIQQLVDEYQLPTDAQTKARHAATRKPKATSLSGTPGSPNLFSAPPLQPYPTGFAKKARGTSAVTAASEDGELPDSDEAEATPAVTPATTAAALPAPVITPAVALSRHFSEADRVLVVEMNGPGRYGQFSPRREFSQVFFGWTLGMPSRSIALFRVAADGSQQFEGAKEIGHKEGSRNYYFELGAKTEVPFVATARPIAVFIHADTDRFLYCLVGQATSAYNELRALIGPNSLAGANSLASAQLTVAQLRLACPSLPFWRMS